MLFPVCNKPVIHFPIIVGWGKDYRNEGFGDSSGMKYQLVQLITSVRTLLRGSYNV